MKIGYKADGFNCCLVGEAYNSEEVLFVYNSDCIISKLMEDDDLDHDNACDFFYSNIAGAVGAGYPIFLTSEEIEHLLVHREQKSYE